MAESIISAAEKGDIALQRNEKNDVIYLLSITPIKNKVF
jgi:hypothetical protein